MQLETANKKIDLKFSLRKIAKLIQNSEEKNLEDIFMKALKKNDIEKLAEIIYSFAENETPDKDGNTKSFSSADLVYDFLDDYMKEKNLGISDIFKAVAEAINEEGFFNTRMDQETLQKRILDPLSDLNLNEIVQNSTEKAIAKIASEEFQGHRG